MIKNNGKRIWSMLTVAILLLAAVMFISPSTANYDNVEGTSESTIPGYGIWQAGRWAITGNVAGGRVETANNLILNTSTSDLVYEDDSSNNIVLEVNGSKNWGTTVYYLYYPVYYGDTQNTYSLTWKQYQPSNGPIPSIQIGTGNDDTFGESGEGSIVLNVTGLWLIDNDGTHNARTSAQMNSTIPAWFWVNASTELTIDISDNEFEFDSDDEITIDVDQGNETQPTCMIDIRADYNNRSIFTKNYWAQQGQVTKKMNDTVFLWAGDYYVYTYKDLEESSGGTETFYYEGSNYKKYYNYTYNASDIWSQATTYNWSICGPWDPPEYDAEPQKITVTSATPIITVENATQYYSFSDNISINVTDSSGNGIIGMNVTILNETGNWHDGTGTGVYHATEVDATNHPGNYTINKNWTRGSTGTWTIVARIADYNSYTNGSVGQTRWEEFNGTAEFTVESAPGLQIKIIDDGDGDRDLEVPAGPGAVGTQGGTIDIDFQVINESHSFYGNSAASAYGDATSAMENITISGDACLLSGKTLKELNGIGDGIVTIDGNTWTVNLLPRMDTLANGGGQISISATWKDHGGAAEAKTITIGGGQANGSLVEISPTEFPIDENVTLTVTVTDPSNPTYGYINADVRLYYVNDRGRCEHIIDRKSTADNVNGEYTFTFNTTQQTTNQTLVTNWTTYYEAPRYIAAYASIGNSEYGYGYAKLTPRNDFKVTAEARDTTSSAGTNVMMAGRDYDRLLFNVSMVDSIGNTTGWPTIGSGQDVLHFRIFNSTGDDVTDNISASFTHSDLKLDSSSDDANHSISGSNHYIIKPGEYSVYCWNKTHDSTGNNATLIVKRVDIQSELGEYIWNVDENVSDTYTITYEGEAVEGKLIIDNMTHQSTDSYNKTWQLTNYTGSADNDGSALFTNVSKKNIDIEEGTLTINNVTANYLPEDEREKNVTFWFKSDKAGSIYARMNGRVPVKIPDVSPSPGTLPYNEPAELQISVTGRGTGLSGVLVNITIPGLDGEQSTQTDSEGIALFAFTPRTTGDIEIEIENRTSETKVKVTAWKLYLDAPSLVDEQTAFSVTVRNATASGSAIDAAIITFNKETFTTGTDGKVTIPADKVPSVTATRDFTIVATKEGYAEDTDVVTIVNVPMLIIVPPSEVPTAGSTFEVVVADDAGNAVIGATVTIVETGDTFTSGTQGIATITAPTDEGTYTVTATKTGFQDSTTYSITVEAGGIPGFELLTLLAALGVAFILLRRRRH